MGSCYQNKKVFMLILIPKKQPRMELLFFVG